MQTNNEAVLREALEFAASTIELFDDATMRSGYRLDSTDCAEIIRALIESPRIRALAATATVAKEGEPADNLLASHINHTAKTLYTPKPEASAEQPAGEVVAIVDEGDDGLFVEIVHGKDGTALKLGDKLYLAAPISEDAGNLVERVAHLEGEEEISEAVIRMMSRQLASIAITLKGEDAALKRHSYHDLAELVKVMALELDLYKTIYGETVPEGWENGAAASRNAGVVESEPDMLWQADDGEVFAHGPDEFANDYANNVLRPGEEAEVRVDCAHRSSQRTIHIAVAQDGADYKVTWNWVGVPATTAPDTSAPADRSSAAPSALVDVFEGGRKLVGYGDCRCILTKCCDGKCAPIFVDRAAPTVPGEPT